MSKESAATGREDRLVALVFRLAGGHWLRWVWRRLFRHHADAFLKRLTYSIRDRGSVGLDEETGELGVRYFPRRESGTLDALPFFELFADGSRDSRKEKLRSLLFLSILLAAPACIVFSNDFVTRIVGAAHYANILMIIAAIAFALSLLASVQLRVHFIQMDNHWRTSISRLLAADIRTKMFGIKESVSSFRQFIKWRRLMTYFFIVAGIYIFAVQIPLILWVVLTDRSIAHLRPAEMLPLLLILAVQVGCITRFSYLVWLYTSVRDPTLPLCVMLVETDRDVVAAMRAGARMPD